MKDFGRIEQAIYSDVAFPEFQGNPLIEALPAKLNKSSLLDSLKVYPPLPTEFRFTGDEMDREDFLLYIKQFRQPLEIYYDVFRAVERAIKEGYSSKNPFSPTTQHYLHYPTEMSTDVIPFTGQFISRGVGITLIGESGTGKTSMLELILKYFPQVINHSTYRDKPLGFKEQVVWIKVECPDKSSVRELCESILYALDAVTGAPFTKPASNHSGLMFQIEQRIKSSYLGVLVIDEMQNLCLQRTSGESGLLKFIKKIINTLGVPVLFCANPAFGEMLISVPQNARRSENGGAYYMERLSFDSIGWKTFVSQLWLLQWTNVETPLTPELEKKLYELTVGNVDFACRTYIEAQRMVLGTDDESICEVVLQEAYERACVHSSRSSDVLSAKEGLKLVHPNSDSKKQVDKKTFIPSVDRPQHPEFYDQLRSVQFSKTLREDIQNPDLIQSASDENDPLEYLQYKGLICEDPLFEDFVD
jgi:hypothetical protein|tara:strand:+ start:5744 stop:7165 length:1422 start_codon:yes stop_codon:yes gene_type:complete